MLSHYQNGLMILILKIIMKNKIYFATKNDVPWMMNLSHQKRLEYSYHQPNFWKMSRDSNKIQHDYFLEQIHKEEILAICYQDNLGFVIGEIISPPGVYDAGLTLKIDDFCVRSGDLWHSVGLELIEEIKFLAKNKGVKQVLVVSGAHDKLKNDFLVSQKLGVASQWFVGDSSK